MRPPEVNTPSRLPALSERLEASSCAGGTRRFMHALRRCHGSKANRRCAAYLAEKLEPSGRSGGRSPYSESYYAGWIWCSGTSVKAVDFIHYDEKNNEWNLLQVKNRDNTENSSSSKIRDNTTIKKWFRTYSQRDTTN